MARHHRRQKQDVRRAVTESATRVRADIEALSDKVDQLSRRNVLSCAGQFLRIVGAGVVVNHLPGGRTQNPRQEGRDVTHHRVNARPATFRFDTPEPSVTVRRGAADLRV